MSKTAHIELFRYFGGHFWPTFEYILGIMHVKIIFGKKQRGSIGFAWLLGVCLIFLAILGIFFIFLRAS